jgi:superfamily I DNA/RNA helicase
MFAVDDESADSIPGASKVLANLPDIVKIMDVQQEQFARSMGAGHRVIHGVAGSGKTLILGFRCLHLAEFSRKPVLVLCFNITLAARLRSFLAKKGITEKVQVYHFHDWCGEQLKTYHVEVQEDSGEKSVPIWGRQVTTVIDAVEKEQIPRPQYGALLIDEGHDFEADWLKLVTQMIDPEKDSLLLLYDDAQSIYKKKDRLDFSLSSVGIQARGRTTVLKMNYRNTRQILNFAYNFSKDFIQERQSDEDAIPRIAPEMAGQEGIEPVVKVWGSLTEEAEFIAHCISTWVAKGKDKGIELKDIAVVYTSKAVDDSVEKALSKAKLDHRYLKNSYQKRQYSASEDKVTVLTRQSSKGLEFKTVILAGLGTLKDNEKNHAEEVRLLYVGMTRAREKLLVTSSKANFYTELLLG